MTKLTRGAKGIIGFDIDGVLTDECVDGVNIWQREVEAHFPGLELLKPSFAFTSAYGLSPSSVQEFMEAKALKIFSEVLPQAGSKTLLTYLMDQGFTIHLITAREVEYKDVTQAWLQRHGLPYTELWFQESKGVLCHALDIEVFVDDYWQNCLDIRNYGVISLLMTAHHNLPYGPEKGIHRVGDWREIESFAQAHYGLKENWMHTSGA